MFILAQLAQTPSTPVSPVMEYLPFLLMLGVIYFMILRPQMRAQKELKKMIAELKIGDEIVFSQGLHGRVSALETDTVKVKIAPETEITIDKASVTFKKSALANQKLK